MSLTPEQILSTGHKMSLTPEQILSTGHKMSLTPEQILSTGNDLALGENVSYIWRSVKFCDVEVSSHFDIFIHIRYEAISYKIGYFCIKLEELNNSNDCQD